ncbi:MAG: 2-C-methyl-D-erythritol 2,4-cyclodiphosphate synthase [Terriglobia bacterium]|jgi:2-C-methyl-D-erythritol 2,4-cyclodiphosphate synthase
MNPSRISGKRSGRQTLSEGTARKVVPPPAATGLNSLLRVGIGNDLHRLAPGRKLILGGVRIPFDQGPIGHSDGDVLAHAICDALLGAARLGDIGRHFPNTSPQWKNASSLLFLRHVRQLIDAAGYSIINIDATVGLERPQLASHIPSMERKVAAALRLKLGQVSVKAKSGEGLDAVGRGEAIRADAVALIQGRP